MLHQWRCMVVFLLVVHIVGIAAVPGPFLMWTGYNSLTAWSAVMRIDGVGDTIYDTMLQGDVRANILLSNFFSVKAGIAYDYSEGLVFWTDPLHKVVYKASFNNGAVDPVYSEISNSVEGIAVDWINNKLYWTDSSYNWIMVSDYSGDNVHTVVHTGLDRPRGIAVHPLQGQLYWCDLGDSAKIEKSNLNGEKRETIVSESENVEFISRPNGLTIDYDENRLYWVDSGLKKIMSVDIDSSFYTVREIFEEETFIFPFDITLDQNFFFVGDQNTGRIWAIDRTDTESNSFATFGTVNPIGMTYYSEWRQEKPQTESNCTINNGGCDQLCVGDPGGHVCLCKHGFMLASDESSCNVDNHHVPGHQVLLSTEDSVCRIPVDFVHVAQPVNEVCFIHGIQATAIDYNYHQDMLYVYDNTTKAIRRTSLREGEQFEDILTNMSSVHGLAIDWLANNIYWTDSDDQTIYIAKLNGLYKTRLITANIDQPRGIAVHPDQKLLFWADVGSTPSIQKSSLSGRQRESLVSGEGLYPTAISIDINNNRLYWADSYANKIEFITFDATQRGVISTTSSTILGMSIFQDHLYWAEDLMVTDFDHVTGDITGTTEVSGRPIGVLAFDKAKQVLTPGPCDIQNGGCDELCIPTAAGAECLCSDPKSQTCTPVARCPIHFFSGSMTGSCINTPGYTCRFDCNEYFVPTTVSSLLCQQNGEWDIDTDSLCKLDISLELFMLVGDTQSDSGQIFHINALSPTLEYVPLPLIGVRNPIAIDFDYVTNKVYWSDALLKTINRASLDGSNMEIVVSVELEVPDGIALDTVNRRLYWTDTGTDRIERINLDGTDREVLVIGNLDQPRAIIVDNDEGFIYWSDWGLVPKIEQANTDGSGRRTLVSSDLGWPNGLTHDRTDHKLFWCDASLDTIEYYDLVGRTRQQLITLEGDEAHPFSLTVVGEFIYWTQWDKTQLQRADKSTGSNVVSVGHQIFERPNDIGVFSSSFSTTTVASTTKQRTTTPPPIMTTVAEEVETTESTRTALFSGHETLLQTTGESSTSFDNMALSTIDSTTKTDDSSYAKVSGTEAVIGGGAGGGVVVIVVVIVCVAVLCKRRKAARHPAKNDEMYCDIQDPIVPTSPCKTVYDPKIGNVQFVYPADSNSNTDEFAPSAPPAPVPQPIPDDYTTIDNIYDNNYEMPVTDNPTYMSLRL